MPQQYNFIPQGGFGGQNMANFNQGAQKLTQGLQSINQMRQARQQQERQQLGKTRLIQMMEADADPREFLKFAVEFPEFKAQADEVSKNLSTEAKTSLFNEAAKTWAALDSNDVETAMGEVTTMEKMYRDGGLVDQADAFGSIKRALNIGGEKGLKQAKTIANMMMTGIDMERFEKVIDLRKTRSETFKATEEGGLKAAETKELEQKIKEGNATAKDRARYEKLKADELEQTVEIKKKTKEQMKEELDIKRQDSATRKKQADMALNQYEATAKAARMKGMEGYKKFNEKELTALNDQKMRLETLQSNLIDPKTGKPVKFGGAPDAYKRAFDTWWDGQDNNQRDNLMMGIKEMAIQAAMTLKEAGAMSDSEYAAYMTSVPDGNSNQTVVSKWLSDFEVKNNRAFVARSIHKAYMNQFQTSDPLREKGRLKLGGKEYVVNANQDAEQLIRKLGVKGLDKLATQFESAPVAPTIKIISVDN